MGALGDSSWIRAVEWKVVSGKNSHHSGREGCVQILEAVAERGEKGIMPSSPLGGIIREGGVRRAAPRRGEAEGRGNDKCMRSRAACDKYHYTQMKYILYIFRVVRVYRRVNSRSAVEYALYAPRILAS